MQVNSDGYTPNKRLNLAMGLSSIHIAHQTYQKYLQQVKVDAQKIMALHIVHYLYMLVQINLSEIHMISRHYLSSLEFKNVHYKQKITLAIEAILFRE